MAAATNDSEVMLHEVTLHGVTSTVKQAFKNNRPAFVNKILVCIANRFDDLQRVDAMKGVNLLNYIVWPIDTAAFDTFGDKCQHWRITSNHC